MGISKVKVQPILPEEENKDSLPTPPDQRRETDLRDDACLVKDTMGSAYLSMLPKGVRVPSNVGGVVTRDADRTGRRSGSDMAKENGGSKMEAAAASAHAGENATRRAIKQDSTKAHYDELPLASKGGNAGATATASAADGLRSILKVEASKLSHSNEPWLQPGYIEPLSVKQLKEACKRAKEDLTAHPGNAAKAHDFLALKARYQLAKNDKKTSSAQHAGLSLHDKSHPPSPSTTPASIPQPPPKVALGVAALPPSKESGVNRAAMSIKYSRRMSRRRNSKMMTDTVATDVKYKTVEL